MTEPTDYEIVAAMIELGGSFVSRLGQAWQAADADNRAKLQAAFPEYWAYYRMVAAASMDSDMAGVARLKASPLQGGLNDDDK